jgi:chromatin remodeling complex protein RSC6
MAAKKTAKKAVKKASPKVAKKAPAKKPAKKSANSAFMKPMQISATLAVVVGKGPMARSEVVKKLWAYIKKQGLQDPKNKRNINADAALKAVFGGKGVVNMFEMTKLVSKHLS